MSSRRSRSGGTRHLDHVEPVEKVFAEASRGHVRLEVAIGRGHDPHVRAPRLRLPHALELLVLQEAQELGLQGGRDLRDLVEEEGAAVRGLHLARLVLDRAREGAAGMAEQLAGQRALRRGSGHARRRRARAARGLLAWRRRASTPLPVPFSPRSRTAASEPAARRTVSTAACRAADRVARSSSGTASASCPSRSRTRRTSARRWAVRSTRWRICAGVNGLGR